MKFPHTATIARMTETSGKYLYGTTSTSPAFLQPLDVEVAQIYAIEVGKSAAVYLPFTADVRDKDRLTIDGVTYGVKGVVGYGFGNLSHKKAIVERI